MRKEYREIIETAARWRLDPLVRGVISSFLWEPRASSIHMNYRGVVFALVSAALFGASTPAAEALLGNVDRR
jgi:hypothetical protein